MPTQALAYLVSYGRSGFVGRFDWHGSTSEVGQLFARGQRVLLRTARGREVGTVLEPLSAISEPLFPASQAGVLLGLVTAEHEQQLAQAESFAAELTESATQLIASLGLPLTLVEVEPNFDATLAVLHVLSWSDYDSTELLGSLTLQYGCELLLLDETRFDAVARAVTAAGSDHGCGSAGGCGTATGGCEAGGNCATGGGCGTATGGCRSRGCSRGSVGSAAELTAYFAQLREQMQRDRQRLPLR